MCENPLPVNIDPSYVTDAELRERRTFGYRADTIAPTESAAKSVAVEDIYGRTWNLLPRELCRVCGQPDNCGDCTHGRLSEEEVALLMYHCVVCGEDITSTDGEPHTDESSGGDCHERCCDTCHPELKNWEEATTLERLEHEQRLRLQRAYTAD